MVDRICVGDRVKLLPEFFVYRKFRESYHEVDNIDFSGPEKIYQIHLVNYETGERSHAVHCYEDQIIDVKRNDESETKNDEIKVGDFIVPPEHFQSFAESKSGKLKVVCVEQDYVFVDMPITGISVSFIPNKKCLALANFNLKKVQDTDMTIKVGDFVEVPSSWENYPESKAGKLEVLRVDGGSAFLHMPISGIKISKIEKRCLVTDGRNLKKVQNTETKTSDLSDATPILAGDYVSVDQVEFCTNAQKLSQYTHKVVCSNPNDSHCYIELPIADGGYIVSSLSDKPVYKIWKKQASKCDWNAKYNARFDNGKFAVGSSVMLNDLGKSALDRKTIFSFFSNAEKLKNLTFPVLEDESDYIRIKLPEGFKELGNISKDYLCPKNCLMPALEKPNDVELSVGSLVALNAEGIKDIDGGGWCLPHLVETAKKSHYKITHIFRCKDFGLDQDKILEYEVKPEHEDLKERTFYLPPNWVRTIKKEEKEEVLVNTKKKFNVGDSVYVPLRHAENLPNAYYNRHIHNSCEYYSFSILNRKTNKTCTDYFVAIDWPDGGKCENGLYGYWLKEEFLLSREEMENEKRGKNAPTSKEEKNMSKETSVDLSVYKEQMKELRTFDVILAPTVEFGKTCIRYAVHLALSAIGKSNKFIEAAFTMLDEFIDHNAQLADSAIRWILGFLAKNVHLIRKIPVIGEWKVLEFLERPEIQRFGVYAQASSEGRVLGDFITKILGLVQEWIFGSAVATRITDAIQSEEGLIRFMSGLDSNMKKGLAERLRVENESEHEAQAEAEMAGQKVAAAT